MYDEKQISSFRISNKNSSGKELSSGLFLLSAPRIFFSAPKGAGTAFAANRRAIFDFGFLGDADGGERERRRGGSFVDLAFGEGIGAMTDESDFGDGAVERVQFFRR